MRPQAAGMTALVMAACSPAPLSLPEGTELAALARVDRGALTEITPIVDVRTETLYAADGPGALLAFTWAVTDEGTALGVGRREPVVTAEGCVQTLSPPEVVLLDGELASFDLPPLGGRWLAERCPTLSAERMVLEIPCHLNNRCPTEVIQTGPCRYRFDARPCGLGLFEWVVDASGRGCIDAPGCVPLEPSGDAPVAASCTLPGERMSACRVQVDLTPERPFATVDAVALHELPFQPPQFLSDLGILNPNGLDGTRAPSVPVHGSTVVVATYEPLESAELTNCRGPEGVPVMLRRFDRASLQALEAWPAPPCTRRLAAFEGTLYSVAPTEDGVWIQSRDLDGQIIAERRFNAATMFEGAAEPRALAAGPELVGLLLSVNEDAVVLSLNARTLELVQRFDATEAAWTIAAGGSAHLPGYWTIRVGSSGRSLKATCSLGSLRRGTWAFLPIISPWMVIGPRSRWRGIAVGSWSGAPAGDS